jgi:hypothetical protein
VCVRHLECAPVPSSLYPPAHVLRRCKPTEQQPSSASCSKALVPVEGLKPPKIQESRGKRSLPATEEQNREEAQDNVPRKSAHRLSPIATTSAQRTNMRVKKSEGTVVTGSGKAGQRIRGTIPPEPAGAAGRQHHAAEIIRRDT